MANSTYVYCPLCGTHLEERTAFGHVRRACSACGFVHFPDPKVAVIGLVYHQGRVLLAKRAVDPAKGKWALPGGFMDAGEMPEAALGRELMEEVGMEIRVDRLLDIFPMTGHGATSRGIVLAYLVRPRHEPPAALQARDDIDAVGWFGPKDLPGELAFESTRTLLTLFEAILRSDNGR